MVLNVVTDLHVDYPSDQTCVILGCWCSTFDSARQSADMEHYVPLCFELDQYGRKEESIGLASLKIFKKNYETYKQTLIPVKVQYDCPFVTF